MVWIVFAAAGAAFRAGNQVAIEMIVDLMPKKMQKIMEIFISVVVIVVLAYLFYQSIGFINIFVQSGRATPMLKIPYTIIYGIGEAFNGNLIRKDLRAPGPYNTYLNMGLPPTPISMPTAASIHAALNPAKTKYLYFVARGDGTTHFSKSLAEHNRAVEKYQKAPARRARARL